MTRSRPQNDRYRDLQNNEPSDAVKVIKNEEARWSGKVAVSTAFGDMRDQNENQELRTSKQTGLVSLQSHNGEKELMDAFEIIYERPEEAVNRPTATKDRMNQPSVLGQESSVKLDQIINADLNRADSQIHQSQKSGLIS